MDDVVLCRIDQLLASVVDNYVTMYVTAVPNRGAKPTILLRESFRDEGKVRNRTLANLTHLPPQAVDAVKRILKGEELVAPEEAFEIVSTRQHGNVDAVLTGIRRLGLHKLIASRRCRERDLVLSMVAARILEPASKLETTRWWSSTTLPEQLGIADADENELYAAMDWLLARQPAIEKKLAGRHLEWGGMVLYDLTSTWLEGSSCPLGALGHSRDKKRGKLQINFGMLTDQDGRPVSVTVYKGNTADSSTVQEQVKKLKESFGIELVVFVGDRGMVTETQIDNFIEQDSVAWISALRSGSLGKLKREGSLQLDLFDERNLFEFESEHYPGERLVACRNPDLATRRARKRRELIAATKAEIEKVQGLVRRGRLRDGTKIGLRVGRVINKYKVAKHFKLEIADDVLRYRVRSDRVKAEAALDGIYVIRTIVPSEVMTADEVVRNYKRLTRIERAFRSMKTVSLRVRPVYHHTEARVRAHIFLCMLAYYVEWHMRQAWTSMLFADEVDDSRTRDPVARSLPSASARRKASTKRTTDGTPAQSFRSLLTNLASVARNKCRRINAGDTDPTFEMTTRPGPLQSKALGLLANL